MFEIGLNGKKRKELAAAIGKILNEEAVYLKTPSCAYRIGEVTLTKDSELAHPEGFETENLKEELVNQGFSILNKEPSGLTIEIKSEKFTEADLGKLKNLLLAKGNLIKKALGADTLDANRKGEIISFPWFGRLPEIEEIPVYTRFIEQLLAFVVRQNRVNPKENESENEKYSFRCFLLRLGYIGDEFKEDRKVLLRNLKGSSAFRNR